MPVFEPRRRGMGSTPRQWSHHSLPSTLVPMCRSGYQVGLARKAEQERIILHDEEVREWLNQGHYNICPKQNLFAVYQEGNRWAGKLVRFGVNQINRPQPLINMRDDTLKSKPEWFDSFQRVTFPMSGFYEFPTLAGRKQVYAIRPVDHDDHWWFAGLMKFREGEDQAGVVTVDPTAYMSELHSRWPFILHPEDRATWLDPATHRDDLFALMQPPPDEWADAYEVSGAAGNWRNDYPELLNPVA